MAKDKTSTDEAPPVARPDATIYVDITRTVYEDYKIRGVFPDLRPENARKVGHAWRHDEVPVSRARELMADARERWQYGALSGGTKNGYTTLIRRISWNLDRRASEDEVRFMTSKEQWQQRRLPSSADEYRQFVAAKVNQSLLEALDLMMGDVSGQSMSWRLTPQDVAQVGGHLDAAWNVVKRATVLEQRKPLEQRVREAKNDDGFQGFLGKLTGQ